MLLSDAATDGRGTADSALAIVKNLIIFIAVLVAIAQPLGGMVRSMTRMTTRFQLGSRRRNHTVVIGEKAKGRHGADLSLVSSWRQYIRGRGEDWDQ
ncbi:hypothetical protein [Mesorhizobium hawassense]|uniref:hypothetical protein n=1 Tax=Mesorhizobium hawassense TaxID=1209954 RepID=UPI00142D3FD0|nr:hypothetical protein [Mesorhizobium hawassense]